MVPLSQQCLGARILMSTERGFTLIEIIVALGILTAVVLGLAAVSVGYISSVTITDRRETALQLADSRIDQIQMDPNYGGLESSYAGTESSFPTLAGVTRTTVITRVTSSSNDFKRITVTVSGPGITQGLSRTITVAAP